MSRKSAKAVAGVAPVLPDPVQVALAALHPSKRNPRRKADEAAIKELAASIAKVGVLQPILVRRILPAPRSEHPDFEIVAGHRRVAAAKVAGMAAVPAIVLPATVDDEQAAELAVVENIQREDMNAWDTARAVHALAKEGHDVGEIAGRLGKSPKWVARRLALSGLEVVFEKARKRCPELGDWSLGHLEILASLTPDAAARVLSKCRAGDGLPSIQELKEDVGGLTHQLKSAPWKLDDETLDPKAGACLTCPKTSACTPGLFEDTIKDPKEAICRDPHCWVGKIQAWRDLKIAAARKEHGSALALLRPARGSIRRGSRRGDSGGRWNRLAPDRIPVPKGRVLDSYEVRAAKRGTKGAIPAVVINGRGLGTVRWVRLESFARHGAGGKAPKKKAAEKSPREQLNDANARLRNRRQIWIIQEAGRRLDALKGNPPPTATLLSLIEAYGVKGPQGAGSFRAIAKRMKRTAVSELFQRLVKEELVPRMHPNLGHRPDRMKEALYLTELLAGVKPGDLEKAAAVEIPEPKSLARLREQVKKGPRKATKKKPAKKTRSAGAGEETPAQIRKRQSRSAAKRKAAKRGASK